MRCLSSSKMSMLVDIIKPQGAPTAENGGHWEYVQDPDSGALIHVWVEDNPDTPEVEGNIVTSRCIAKAALSGSIRAAEQFGAEYLNEEWVKLTLPFNANITMRDKVANIRTLKGQALWSEEEMDGSPATKFDVFRVTPVIDGFGNVIEKVALIKRAEVQ